jgi:trimeric autotransporter adhesin
MKKILFLLIATASAFVINAQNNLGVLQTATLGSPLISNGDINMFKTNPILTVHGDFNSYYPQIILKTNAPVAPTTGVPHNGGFIGIYSPAYYGAGGIHFNTYTPQNKVVGIGAGPTGSIATSGDPSVLTFRVTGAIGQNNDIFKVLRNTATLPGYLTEENNLTVDKNGNSYFGLSRALNPTTKPLDPRVSILGNAGQDGFVVRTITSGSYNGYAGFFSNINTGGSPSPKFGVYGEAASSASAYSVTNYGGYFKATANTPMDAVYGVAGVVESCGPSYAVYGEVVNKTGCPTLVTPKWAGYFKGNTNVTDNLTLGGAFMPNNNAGTAGFILKSNGANVAPSWIDPTTIAAPNAWKLNGNSNADGSSFVGTTTSVDLVFKANNAEALRINSANQSKLFSSSETLSAEFNSTNNFGNTLTVSSTPSPTSNNYPVVGIDFKVGPFLSSPTTIVPGRITADVFNGMQIGTTVPTGNLTFYSKKFMVFNSSPAVTTKNVIMYDGKISLGQPVGEFNFGLANTFLNIKTNVPNTSGIRLADMNSTSPETELTDKFLTLNNWGEVVMGKSIPYIINATVPPTADGSETKITAGAHTVVLGVGTVASPYQISSIWPVIPTQAWTTSTLGSNSIINNNSGAVIIGNGITTLPTGYKMYVENGILTEKVKVAIKNGTQWADYVFDKSYKLVSLSEVEKFIEKNKHLPSVPSSEELVKEGGIDVNKMFAKQMEKIEELTLYLIEMNKKIERLEKENQALKATK